jgi:ribosomal protein L2
MLLLKKFKKIIPSFRHKTNINIFDNIFHFLKNKKYTKFLKKKNLIKRKKNFYNKKLIKINSQVLNYHNLICKNFFYDFKPYKKTISCQTIYNINYNIPGLDKLNVGTIIIIQKNLIDNLTKSFFKGSLLFLHIIPYNVNFCNVTNFLDNKLTYSKSSGTFCKKKQIKKIKKKLLLIILPSLAEIFLNKNCKAYVGENQNFTVNKLVEGKFGFSFHKQKKIKVRGVAMNPVDHPNGGRAKTVQPERSP